MKKTFKKILPFVCGTVLWSGFFLLFANVSFGQETGYIPLAPLPGLGDKGEGITFTNYVPTVFKLLIAVAAALAIIMIVIGGIQYMSTDAISGKSAGKERITYALQGLVLALVSWLILQTINPDLLKFDIISK